MPLGRFTHTMPEPAGGAATLGAAGAVREFATGAGVAAAGVDAAGAATGRDVAVRVVVVVRVAAEFVATAGVAARPDVVTMPAIFFCVAADTPARERSAVDAY